MNTTYLEAGRNEGHFKVMPAVMAFCCALFQLHREETCLTDFLFCKSGHFAENKLNHCAHVSRQQFIMENTWDFDKMYLFIITTIHKWASKQKKS